MSPFVYIFLSLFYIFADECEIGKEYQKALQNITAIELNGLKRFASFEFEYDLEYKQGNKIKREKRKQRTGVEILEFISTKPGARMIKVRHIDGTIEILNEDTIKTKKESAEVAMEFQNLFSTAHEFGGISYMVSKPENLYVSSLPLSKNDSLTKLATRDPLFSISDRGENSLILVKIDGKDTPALVKQIRYKKVSTIRAQTSNTGVKSYIEGQTYYVPEVTIDTLEGERILAPFQIRTATPLKIPRIKKYFEDKIEKENKAKIKAARPSGDPTELPKHGNDYPKYDPCMNHVKNRDLFFKNEILPDLRKPITKEEFSDLVSKAKKELYSVLFSEGYKRTIERFTYELGWEQNRITDVLTGRKENDAPIIVEILKKNIKPPTQKWLYFGTETTEFFRIANNGNSVFSADPQFSWRFAIDKSNQIKSEGKKSIPILLRWRINEASFPPDKKEGFTANYIFPENIEFSIDGGNNWYWMKSKEQADMQLGRATKGGRTVPANNYERQN